ncbi:hypothetical protein [Lentzea cavernae]|uniref:Lipoprotein n=1 Tax=Lentzea cavernae TaxID=2020703 RepID=A0ABQ3MBJ6_9PSEU|nr:hypothetical protein [Lentzea cavernae]GHH36593.1 hypothetical protein GCM10017774_23690 [Lentzea cavernae]
MRKTIVALAGLLALAGCSSNWQGDVGFKVVEFFDHKIDESGAVEKRVRLEPVGSLPEDAEQDHLKGAWVLEHDIAGTVGVEDGVVCAVRYEADATKISKCKKA